MTETTNYKLKKPAQNDNYNVDDFNGNADIADRELKKQSDVQAAQTTRITALEAEVAQQGAEITQSAADITALQAENAAQGAQLGEHDAAITTLQTDLDAAEEQLAALDAAKAEVVRFALALPASSWSGASAPYTQTLAAAGILATDRPHLGITHSGTAAQQVQQTISGGFITKLESAADSVTFTAQLAKPTVDLQLFLEVVR